MSKPFPALTVYQPWASLIAYEFKLYETRGWKPPEKYIGQLIALHAAKQWTNKEQRWDKVYRQKFPEIGDMPIPRGCIIAMCRLVEVVPAEWLVESISSRERSMGGWEPGRFGWRLEVVRRADPPIDATGKQGIWFWQKGA